MFRLFEGLPRQGPDSDAYTREALRRLGALPPAPRVLDLGCGSGRAALVLAETLRARVIAVDIHPSFLDQLRAMAEERGLADLIEPRCADMAAPGVPAGSIDLLWCEGAVDLLGFENGLRLWRPLLAPGGCLALTECSWLCADPPAEAAAFFCAGYPGILDLEQARPEEDLGHPEPDREEQKRRQPALGEADQRKVASHRALKALRAMLGSRR